MKKSISILFMVIVLMMPTFGEVGGTITRTALSKKDADVNITVNDRAVPYDVWPQIIGGKMMIPLRRTLDTYGFEVSWNGETQTVGMQNEEQYSEIHIGSNNYSKGEMGTIQLSSSPIIIEGRTMVPLEFFYEYFGFVFEVEGHKINFVKDNDQEVRLGLTVHTGKVIDTEINSDGYNTYSLSTNSERPEQVDLLVHVGEDTIVQRKIKVGDTINVITLPIMAMSYPGQVGAITIY